MTYWRKAIRLPIGIAPLLMRWPPNQMMATVERFMIRKSAGIIRAKSRWTRTAVVGEVGVGVLEALLLVLGPHEGADHAHARRGSRA